jgi:hypothetical protein
VLNEELLKSRDHHKIDEIKHLPKDDADFLSFNDSLVELYERGKIVVHLHLTGEVGTGFCLTANYNSGVGINVIDAKPCKKYPPVLADVAKFIQDPQLGGLEVLPTVVRLQGVNLCNNGAGQPREIPFQILFESFCAAANGELTTQFFGITIRSRTEFPYKVVQSGPKILNTVSDDVRNYKGYFRTVEATDASSVRMWLYLSHNEARAALVVPNNLGVRRLTMYFSPSDLLAD